MATSTPTTVTSSVSYTLLDGEDNLVLTGVDDINGTGNSLNNYITGNVGANILDGLHLVSGIQLVACLEQSRLLIHRFLQAGRGENQDVGSATERWERNGQENQQD